MRRLLILRPTIEAKEIPPSYKNIKLTPNVKDLMLTLIINASSIAELGLLDKNVLKRFKNGWV